MPIIGFNESVLTNSESFKIINPPETNATVEKAKYLINNAKVLTNEDIEAAYISVKQITDSLTRSALKAFDEGKIILLYNRITDQAVNQALPFLTFNSKSKGYITYVFMDKYITINRDGVMTLQGPILRDLLIGAVLSNGIKRNYNNLATNQYLSQVLTECYCKFFTRILNREFSIMADRTVFDTVQYWINKFFLLKVFGINDSTENIERISKKDLKYTDEMQYDIIRRQYDEANPSIVSDLLTLLRDLTPRMKGINIKTFISDWINYYYIPSMMAIDNIEYLIFMVITLLNGNNIISIAASDVVKEAKNIKNIRQELLKLI